ncbi:CatA-like O-acetyltransferase [Flavivirga rizhaonensis]|uniref:Chloramphenicol acetyltransferase n=1 Tax=Flavivirga rizhaonensis TaxID=2559571 RepID=A0A4S1DTK7_9FLAO|nr:CatA-like O-acetyltransferase [Flavivirga rizhaonensis]TGV01125.1 chloramphenicol acetyltransferase [Flavivirga rizhaonensis]
MKIIDINTWNRKQHYEHFSGLKDPYFAVIIPFNVTKAYRFSKGNNKSFFAKYLHDCMKAINVVDNFRYRIEDENVVDYNVIHASTTIMRSNKTFGFSFVEYNDDLNIFAKNIAKEKERIENSTALYPPQNGLNCIHCSAMPWLHFSGHKEPVSGVLDSVPKIAFSKVTQINDELIMNVSVNVNHALVDGYHVGLFSEKFQEYLNE